MNARQLFNRWVILGAFLFAGFLTLLTAMSIGWTTPPHSSPIGFAPADLTMIPAPTETSSAPPTPTIDPFAPSPTPTGLALGNYAQSPVQMERAYASAPNPAWTVNSFS